MISVFKSAINIGQMKAKVKQLNAARFEIQLLDKDIFECGLALRLEAYLQEVPDVVMVHTMLDDATETVAGDVNLSYMCNPKNVTRLKEAFYVANRCAETFNHRVGVVMHSSAQNELLKLNNMYLNVCVCEIFALLHMFPLVDLYIENVTPYNMYLRSFDAGNLFDTVDNVLLLRKYIPDGETRIFNTFDFCHARMTIDMLNNVDIKISLEELCEYYSKTTKEVHFSLMAGHGNNDDHDVGYRRELKDQFKDSMRLYNKYFSKALFCYEIREDDYYENKNVIMTQRMVDMYEITHIGDGED